MEWAGVCVSPQGRQRFWASRQQGIWQTDPNLLSATKVVSHLIEKLPGSVGEKCPPAEVLVNIIAVLNNLVVASPIAARDLLYFDGLRKLVFIKKKRDR